MWNTYLIVATITHDQFAAAIDDVYYAGLDDPTEGLNAISLIVMIHFPNWQPTRTILTILWTRRWKCPTILSKRCNIGGCA
jgi:hypothetical protein